MRVLLLALLLLSNLAFADNYCHRIDTSSTNLPATFTGNAILPTADLGQVRTVYIENGTSTEIAVNCSKSASGGVTPSAPATGSTRNIYVAASGTWALPDVAGFGNKCYVRSVSGTISSGVVRICLFGSFRAFP